jgi:hypothetical protein
MVNGNPKDCPRMLEFVNISSRQTLSLLILVKRFPTTSLFCSVSIHHAPHDEHRTTTQDHGTAKASESACSTQVSYVNRILQIEYKTEWRLTLGMKFTTKSSNKADLLLRSQSKAEGCNVDSEPAIGRTKLNESLCAPEPGTMSTTFSTLSSDPGNPGMLFIRQPA